MAFALWTPVPGMTPIHYSGHLEFRDIVIPVPNKDEWGVDTLERRVQGPGHLYANFEKNLKQGQIYQFSGDSYYLQTWRQIDSKVFPGFMLSYKGFRNGVIPDPLPTTSRSELCSSVTAGDLSVTFAGKKIVGATQEIKYIAPTTIWRYLTKTEPTVAVFNTVRGSQGLSVLDSRITITYNDGTTSILAGNAPAGVVSALSVSPVTFVIGPAFNPIVGTPYFEAQEVVQIKFPG